MEGGGTTRSSFSEAHILATVGTRSMIPKHTQKAMESCGQRHNGGRNRGQEREAVSPFLPALVLRDRILYIALAILEFVL